MGSYICHDHDISCENTHSAVVCDAHEFKYYYASCKIQKAICDTAISLHTFSHCESQIKIPFRKTV